MTEPRKRPSEQDYDRYRARCRASEAVPGGRLFGMPVWWDAYNAALAVYESTTYTTFDEMQRTSDRAHQAASAAAKGRVC